MKTINEVLKEASSHAVRSRAHGVMERRGLGWKDVEAIHANGTSVRKAVNQGALRGGHLRCDTLVQVALGLGCSTDYLLGLVAESEPTDGTPP